MKKVTLVVDEEALRRPRAPPPAEEEALKKLKTRTDWLSTPQNLQDIDTNREKLTARERFFLDNAAASPPQARRGPHTPATPATAATATTHQPPHTNGANLNEAAATRIPVSHAANNRAARQGCRTSPLRGVLKKPRGEAVQGEAVDNRPGTRLTDGLDNHPVIPYPAAPRADNALINGNCESPPPPQPPAVPAQPPAAFQDATASASPPRGTIQPPQAFRDPALRASPSKKPSKPLRAAHAASKLPKPHHAATHAPKPILKTSPRASPLHAATQPPQPLQYTAQPTPPPRDAALPSPPASDTAPATQPLQVAAQPPPAPFQDTAQPAAPPLAAIQHTGPHRDTATHSAPKKPAQSPPPPFLDTAHPQPTTQPTTQLTQPSRDTTPPPQPQDTSEAATPPPANPRMNGPVTNGWEEERKEESGGREAEQCRDSASSLEDKGRSGSEGQSLDDLAAGQEEAERGRKASKVSRFVRMFNRRDGSQSQTQTEAASGAETERASGRRSQSRVWAMCLQAQSPNNEDDDLPSSCEVIKCETQLDQCSRDSAASWADTSSLGTEDTQHSLDSVTGAEDKRRSLNIEVEDRSLIRSCGGRRSFDKPQSRSRLAAKRSNTLDDMDDARQAARSSRTLPAKPSTVGGTNSGSNSPFYRRFYSHCMVLPNKKRKKGKNKTTGNTESPSRKKKEEVSQSSDAVSEEERRASEGEVTKRETDKVEESAPKSSPAKRSIKEPEEEPDDSPKRFPVIDGFLAEIMESVTLMEKSMTEDEAEDDDEGEEGCNLSPGEAGEAGEEIDGEDRRSSLELLSEGGCRVSSLISRFEKGSS